MTTSLLLVLGMLWQAPAPGSGAGSEAVPLESLSARPASAARPLEEGAREGEPAVYLVEAAARSSLSYLLPAGPRTVRRLEVVPDPNTAAAWQAARLRLTWESDAPDAPDSGVDLPLGLAFGRPEGGPAVASRRLDGTGPAWVNRFPMPYRTRAILRVDTERPLSGKIRLRTTPGVVDDAGYFRAVSWSLGRPVGPGPLKEPGRGRVVGLLVATATATGGTSPGRLALDGRVLGSLTTWLGPTEGDGDVDVGRWPDSADLRFETEIAVLRDANATAETPRLARAALFWYGDRPAPPRRRASEGLETRGPGQSRAVPVRPIRHEGAS